MWYAITWYITCYALFLLIITNEIIEHLVWLIQWHVKKYATFTRCIRHIWDRDVYNTSINFSLICNVKNILFKK